MPFSAIACGKAEKGRRERFPGRAYRVTMFRQRKSVLIILHIAQNASHVWVDSSRNFGSVIVDLLAAVP